MPYKGDKGDKNAARPPEGSLVETRCLIKGPKSAIVPFPGPRSGPKSRTGPGALANRVLMLLMMRRIKFSLLNVDVVYGRQVSIINERE